MLQDLKDIATDSTIMTLVVHIDDVVGIVVLTNFHSIAIMSYSDSLYHHHHRRRDDDDENRLHW